MSELFSKLNEDMKQAMRDKDQDKLNVLRMLIASAKNKRIELKVNELTDDQVIQVVVAEIKKRKDSIESYEKGGREDLAAQEKKEVKILEAYQPEQMSEEEVEKVVRQVIAEKGEIDKSQFGQVMGACMGQLKGQADGNLVKNVLNKILSE